MDPLLVQCNPPLGLHKLKHTDLYTLGSESPPWGSEEELMNTKNYDTLGWPQPCWTISSPTPSVSFRVAHQQEDRTDLVRVRERP